MTRSIAIHISILSDLLEPSQLIIQRRVSVLQKPILKMKLLIIFLVAEQLRHSNSARGPLIILTNTATVALNILTNGSPGPCRVICARSSASKCSDRGGIIIVAHDMAGVRVQRHGLEVYLEGVGGDLVVAHVVVATLVLGSAVLDNSRSLILFDGSHNSLAGLEFAHVSDVCILPIDMQVVIAAIHNGHRAGVRRVTWVLFYLLELCL